MFIIIEENGDIYKAEALDCYALERLKDGEIRAVDCESMKISNGLGFNDLPEYYEEDDLHTTLPEEDSPHS